MEIKTYKKEAEYSYTLGAFPTFELIDARPGDVEEIIVHNSFTDRERLEEKAGNIRVTENNKLISKLSDKENVYVIGVFRKSSCELEAERRHIVLVNPGNMGNLGTIIRTACGFGYYDLAVIEPAADIFNPKTVRASMGSLFRIRHRKFADFGEYMKLYPDRKLYPFMLDGSCSLHDAAAPGSERFSLIFGNEATGLPAEFAGYGQPVRIEQTEFVDSLNLTIAAGIGMYVFAQEK
ncbi:MAG: TrmH family RNA methyltransferase [Lachnospiraceae bacterium]|nr:TrmH family RNA methyltransferase [Lachnospiraceae bacterium]